MDLPVDLDELCTVLRRHGVSFALVFGSHARDEAGSDSDVDLAVMAPEDVNWWRLVAELPETVDATDLRTAPAWLAGRAALEGVVVLDDEPAARVRWQAETRKIHLDERWRRDRFTTDFLTARG